MYIEAIQTPKDMEQPVHLTLQEGNQGEPFVTSQAYLDQIMHSSQLNTSNKKREL
jgi:hypothetical protein